MIIDSHQHFWWPACGLYPWLPKDGSTLDRAFAAADLRPILDETGVTGTILVQASESMEELSLLLREAATAGFVHGIVAPLDLRLPEPQAALDLLESEPLVVGCRPAWARLFGKDDKPNDAVLRRLAAAGLALDCLVREPAQVEAVARIAAAYPELRLVLDHAGTPGFGNGIDPAWSAAIAQCAAQPNIFCKVSGLLTRKPAPQPAELRAHADRLLEAFGPQRLMWGSDWPVLTTAASYRDWLTLAQRLFEHLTTGERDRIFAGTALAVYRRRG